MHVRLATQLLSCLPSQLTFLPSAMHSGDVKFAQAVNLMTKATSKLRFELVPPPRLLTGLMPLGRRIDILGLSPIPAFSNEPDRMRKFLFHDCLSHRTNRCLYHRAPSKFPLSRLRRLLYKESLSASTPALKPFELVDTESWIRKSDEFLPPFHFRVYALESFKQSIVFTSTISRLALLAFFKL